MTEDGQGRRELSGPAPVVGKVPVGAQGASGSPLVAWVVALGMPLLALLLLATWAGAPLDDSTASQQREALAHRATSVVVMGSSTAQADLDPERLAARLGLDPHEVAVAVVTDSSVPHWYLALRNRIAAAGARPRWIVLPTSLGQALQGRLEEPGDRRRFVAELLGDEPDEVVAMLGPGGRRAVARERLAARGAALAEALVDGSGTLATRLVFGLDAQAARRMFKESDRAFGQMPLDLLEARPELLAGLLHQLDRFDHVADPDDTLLPELLALASDLGARVAVVRVPFPTTNPGTDKLGDEAGAAFGAWLEAHGGVWLDARDLGPSDDGFEDMLHLMPEAATAFTDRVVDALAAEGFWTPVPSPDAP